MCLCFQTKSVLQINFLGNTTFLLAIGASFISLFGLIYVPFLQTIFQTEALSAQDLLKLFGMSSTVLIVDEVFKMGLRIFTTYSTRYSVVDKQSEEKKALIA